MQERTERNAVRPLGSLTETNGIASGSVTIEKRSAWESTGECDWAEASAASIFDVCAWETELVWLACKALKELGADKDTIKEGLETALDNLERL